MASFGFGLRDTRSAEHYKLWCNGNWIYFAYAKKGKVCPWATEFL
jgi:hypothetical protein